MERYLAQAGAALATLLLAAPLAGQTFERRLQLADLREVSSITALEISGAAEYVAFLVTETTDAPPDLWVVAIGGGEPVRLDRDVAAQSGLDWSHDSGAIAYVRRNNGSAELWTTRVSGPPRRACTIPGSAHSLAWVDGGARVAFVARANRTNTEAARASDGGEYRPLVSGDRPIGEAVYACDVTTGEVVRITHDDFWRPEFSWSPDGARLVVSAQREPGYYGALESDLFLVDAETGTATSLVQRPGVDRSPAWSTDGKRVAFVSGFGEVGLIPNLGVAVVEADEGRIHDVGRQHDRGGFFEGPYLYGWSSDGDFIHYSVADGVETPLFRLPVSGGPPERLSDGWGGEGEATHDYRLSHAGDAVAFLRSGENRPAELYFVTEGADARRLTDANPSLASLGVPPARTVRWTSADGTRVEGLLVLPQEEIASRPYATVTVLHGGPAVAYSHGYPGLTFYNPYLSLLLASHGYAVFLPNPRGSGGYGAEFRAAARGDWGARPTADVLSGIDSLVARGIADPDRLALAGWSYGGYLAAWILTQTDRFAAASVGAGVIDLTSHYGQGAVQMNEYFGGPPWRRPRPYRDQSPIHHVENISTPVLVFHGTEDGAVSPAQSELLHSALSFLDVPVRLVRYPGEGHTIRGSAAQDDSWERWLAWLHQWGVAPPAVEGSSGDAVHDR